jgi:orotate phosphoribosyltransferase
VDRLDQCRGLDSLWLTGCWLKKDQTMTAEEVIEKFRDAGALLEGHFILSSGLHSSVYLQCALALESTRAAADFGDALARHFAASEIDIVAAPAIGGIVIGYEVARQLGARFIWTEREDG